MMAKSKEEIEELKNHRMSNGKDNSVILKGKFIEQRKYLVQVPK